jgi:ribulose kinase
LGAAIDAAVGMGLHPDFKTAIAEMTRIGETFEPNSKAHQVYDQLYHQVYLKMYDRLRPFYKAIQEIIS